MLIWYACPGLLYSVLLSGVLTDAIKDAVGRPRPDFFWRCFPNGKGVRSHQLVYVSFYVLLPQIYMIGSHSCGVFIVILVCIFRYLTLSRGMLCVPDLKV